MSKKLPVLLAALALVASSLACAIGDGEPTLSNTRIALDQEGVNTTSTFGTFDTVYVVNDISNGVVGNVVSSKWYAVDLENTDPNFLFDETALTIEEDSFNGRVYFLYPPPVDGAWPIGLYKVEIYFNGILTSSVEFMVQ